MSKSNNTGFSIIAERYAVAFYELAERNNILDSFRDELFQVKAVIESQPELAEILNHPVISPADKKDIIESIFTGQLSQITLNSLKLIVDNRRMMVFPFIVTHYNEILNKKRNIAVAKVITAIQINDETKERVRLKLQEITQKNIVVEPVVDESLIAGMIVKINDRVIDGSIKTKLDNMKKQFA